MPTAPEVGKGEAFYVVAPNQDVDNALAVFLGFAEGYPWVKLLRDHGGSRKGYKFVWTGQVRLLVTSNEE